MDAPSPSKKLQTSSRPPPSLSKEIIQEILPWLPVKSLLRFRCVSKSWRALIDSKLFIKTHLQNSIKNHSFPHQTVILHSLNERPNQSSLLSLLDENSAPPSPLITVNRNLRILGCCNGLVCVLDERLDFFLWNPSTRVISKKLPRIFCPGFEICLYGFGWVESSNEYKVFAFLRGLQYGGRVYSSSTKSWKTIKQSVNVRICCEEGVFVDGKLHWPSKTFILTFDLKSEAYERVEFPPDQEPQFDLCLGVVGGFLCVVYYCLKGRGNRVWVMKDGSWKRVETLRHVLLLLGRPFSSPYALIQNREILLFHGSTFLIYSSLDGVFRCPKIFCRYQSQHLYVESLVSPEFL